MFGAIRSTPLSDESVCLPGEIEVTIIRQDLTDTDQCSSFQRKANCCISRQLSSTTYNISTLDGQ